MQVLIQQPKNNKFDNLAENRKFILLNCANLANIFYSSLSEETDCYFNLNLKPVEFIFSADCRIFEASFTVKTDIRSNRIMTTS